MIHHHIDIQKQMIIHCVNRPSQLSTSDYKFVTSLYDYAINKSGFLSDKQADILLSIHNKLKG